ncbi:MAG: translation elongation factor EF-1 subunit alpha [Candidatus Woesearchaeota archaeon]
MAKQKPHLNVVFIGHVDHGKSTTIGRLLYDSGAVDEQTMRKLKEEAEQRGKVGFEFAYLMDQLREERERGITIDISHKKFDTSKYEITIIDAPGHRDFVKNMITGASQADAAVLVVAADDGVNEQTREHVLLAKTLGINQIIVAINKMDAVKYDQKRFEEVKEEVKKLLTVVGYRDVNSIPMIPLASLLGDNVVKKSQNMPWYTGETLLEAFDKYLKEPEKLINLPLRLPIENVFQISGIGTVPTGKVETGVIKVGQKVVAMPARTGTGIEGEVKSIEMHHEPLQQAEPGDNIGINVRGWSKKDIARGDVIGPVDNPPTVAKEFRAQVYISRHPSVIAPGYTPVFHAHTAQVPGRIVAIEKIIDPKTGQVVKENPDFIKPSEIAIIRVEPLKPLAIEEKKVNPKLSSFAMRDSGMTIGVGIVLEITKK